MLWLVPQTSVAAAILWELSMTTAAFLETDLVNHRILSALVWKIWLGIFVWQALESSRKYSYPSASRWVEISTSVGVLWSQRFATLTWASACFWTVCLILL